MEDITQLKGRLFKVGAFVLVILALFLAVKTVGEYKSLRFIGGGVPVSNTITVSGEGEVFAVPDVGNFTFSVSEEKDTVSEAQDVATEKINAALNIVREGGVLDKDIKTLSYNVYPQYDYIQEACTGFRCPPGKQVLRGYQVEQTISIKVRDTKKAGELLTQIGTTGVTNVSGLNFTIDDEDQLKRDARSLAIKDAKKKAEELANDLGVKLVRVVNFNESGNYPVMFRAMDMAVAESMGGSVAPAKALELPTGENKIVSNVNITYEIR